MSRWRRQQRKRARRRRVLDRFVSAVAEQALPALVASFNRGSLFLATLTGGVCP